LSSNEREDGYRGGRYILIPDDAAIFATDIRTTQPRRIRVAVLLDKPERTHCQSACGLRWLKKNTERILWWDTGLDYAERYRNLADVGVLTLRWERKKNS